MPRQLRRGPQVFEARRRTDPAGDRENVEMHPGPPIASRYGMRSLLLLSMILAATAACSQSLTPNMTGTGGTRTGAGGEGGTGPGSGGSGGSVSSVCNTLVAEYQSAVAQAQTCQVGASGQCQQLVTGSLSSCSCPTYVTDSSTLSAIEDAWAAAGCMAPGPVCDLFCPAALNTTCVAVDGGSTGFCSYVPGTGGASGFGGTSGNNGSGGRAGSGGTTGAGGSTLDGGLSNCNVLASRYAAVLNGARSCTAGAAGQCAQEVPSSLSPCNAGCTTFVTDRSVLDVIRQMWDADGCGNVKVLCIASACAPATGAACVASDAGGSVCSTSYGVFAAP
jgi:hypothetical protein